MTRVSWPVVATSVVVTFALFIIGGGNGSPPNLLVIWGALVMVGHVGYAYGRTGD